MVAVSVAGRIDRVSSKGVPSCLAPLRLPQPVTHSQARTLPPTDADVQKQRKEARPLSRSGCRRDIFLKAHQVRLDKLSITRLVHSTIVRRCGGLTSCPQHTQSKECWFSFKKNSVLLRPIKMRSSQDVHRVHVATGWTPVGFATFVSSYAMPLVHVAASDLKANLLQRLNGSTFLGRGIQTYGKSTSVQLRCVLCGRSSRHIADRIQSG